MGAPVKIVDVAHKMILLLNGTNKDTFVIFTGLRPGEKLAEDLFCHDERALPTSHPMIRLAARDWQSSTNGALPSGFRGNLRHLISLAEQDAPATAIVEALQSCVPTYVPLVWTTGPQVDASRGSALGTDELVGRLDTPDAVEAIRLSTPGRTLEIARSATAHDV
jgi:hypothetical protein